MYFVNSLASNIYFFLEISFLLPQLDFFTNVFSLYKSFVKSLNLEFQTFNKEAYL